MRNILLIIALLISGCATAYNAATGKNEFILINTKMEISLGKSIANQMQRELKLSKDYALKDRLKLIGQKVSRASDRKDLEYQFEVVDDKELNAFALPGGFIFVNSGLIEKATDDELASVIGHEIGHIAARHGVKRLELSLGYTVIMSIAFGKAGYTDIAKALDTVFNVVALGYSREDERLADKLGAKYAYNAEYDPEGMITFFKKLDEENKSYSQPLVFLSSHPPVKERIKNSQNNIDILKGITAPSQSTPLDTQKMNNVKTCPKCKRTYSSKYQYCIKDGSRLE